MSTTAMITPSTRAGSSSASLSSQKNSGMAASLTQMLVKRSARDHSDSAAIGKNFARDHRSCRDEHHGEIGELRGLRTCGAPDQQRPSASAASSSKPSRNHGLTTRSPSTVNAPANRISGTSFRPAALARAAINNAPAAIATAMINSGGICSSGISAGMRDEAVPGTIQRASAKAAAAKATTRTAARRSIHANTTPRPCETSCNPLQNQR